MPTHILYHYALFVTHAHTSSLQHHPHTHHFITSRCMDRPYRGDITVSQMYGEAGWWTTSEKIGLPTPLARVNGVGRQQHSTP